MPWLTKQHLCHLKPRWNSATERFPASKGETTASAIHLLIQQCVRFGGAGPFFQVPDRRKESFRTVIRIIFNRCGLSGPLPEPFRNRFGLLVHADPQGLEPPHAGQVFQDDHFQVIVEMSPALQVVDVLPDFSALFGVGIDYGNPAGLGWPYPGGT